MAYEPPALTSALAEAVGDDPSLIAELRSAFLESARRQADALSAACNETDWRTAAWRLQGLAASFGATALMSAAGEAAQGTRGDRETLARVATAMAACEA